MDINLVEMKAAMCSLGLFLCFAVVLALIIFVCVMLVVLVCVQLHNQRVGRLSM